LGVVGTLGLAIPLMVRGPDSRPGLGLLVAFCVFLFLVVCLVFCWLLISQLMVPIMYRQLCRAPRAFAQTVRLIAETPGPLVLYALFFVVLMLAAILISCAVTCATCCIAAIPYVGTVILLPIPVTLGAFSLLFLRQFGPDYDVWTVLMPPEISPGLLPPPAPSGTEAG
jgi:hypothetical protein